MAEIRLSPSGHLSWQADQSEGSPAALAAARAAFERDWREGLAAERAGTGDSLTLGYWRRIGERYLTGLCHLPGASTEVQVTPPSEADLAEWVLSAPPMTGGEYLSASLLDEIWGGLEAWVQQQVSEAGDLEALLTDRAPKWQQVGRVCFHLAENRQDVARPFAFLATYATGFGAAGRLKHLPLGKALEQYAGAKNRPALIKLLTPVHEAAKRCAWVHELVESGQVYQPQAWTPEQARRVLCDAAELEDSGLAVRLPDWWRKRPRPQVSVTIGQQQPARLGADALLDFNVRVAVGARQPERPEAQSEALP